MKAFMLARVLSAAVVTCAAAGVLCADQPEDEAAIRKSAETYVETGIANLTQNETSALLHFADGQTQQWLMVRVEGPQQ